MNNCSTWADIADRIALGDAVSKSERAFVSSHIEECDLCRREAEFYLGLSGLLSQGSEAQPLPASSRESAKNKRRWVRFSQVAAIVAAAGVALTFTFLGRDDLAQSPQAPAQVSATSTKFVLISGDVSLEGAQPLAGADLDPLDEVVVGSGQACLGHENKTTTCIDSQSRVELVSSTAAERRLFLREGRVVCQIDEHHEGRFFRIETVAGTITATGTVFAVEMRDQEVLVRLHRGSVEVRSADGRVRKLRAPAAVSLNREIGDIKWDQDVAEADLDLVAPATLWDDSSLTRVDISGAPDGSQVQLDRVTVGRTPLSLLVPPGTHQLAFEKEGHQVKRLTVGVQGSTMQVDGALEPTEVEATPAAQARTGQTMSSAQMLSAAQDLRASGQLAQAVTLYRRLVASYPGKPEARAALLSLGALELGSLSNPAAALGHYQRYLNLGGPLAQEASFGKIRALQRLGRAREAQQAIEEFTNRYPNSAQAATLRDQMRSPANVPSHESGAGRH